MIIFLVVFPHMAGFPMFIYPFVVLFICYLYLRINKENFKDIGLRFKDLNGKSFLIGGIIGLAYACFDYWLFGPFVIKITGLPNANVSDFDFIKHSFINYLLLLAIAWLIVIPYEEIVFRGFILSKIRNMLSSSKWQFSIAGLITSVLFGLYHVQEGMAGVLNAFFFGIVVTWLYYKCKGNLWYLIFFHAVYDTFMLTAIRLDYM
jgi:membrane protease YdiL (CAAX protease family)